MSPARWFVVPYYLMAHFVGGIFAFPLALMFMNFAAKRSGRYLKPISIGIDKKVQHEQRRT